MWLARLLWCAHSPTYWTKLLVEVLVKLQNSLFTEKITITQIEWHIYLNVNWLCGHYIVISYTCLQHPGIHLDFQ